MELTVAITGASGSIYAHRTLLHMAASGAVERVNLVMSRSARVVARVELGAKIEEGDAGARILPASPGFYHRPQTIEQLVDHLVFRILDQFGIPHPTGTRWKGETGETMNAAV